MDKVTSYIRSASDSLLKINDNLIDMIKVVTDMNSPKQTKAETQKKLLENLKDATKEMLEVSKKTNELSKYVHNPARDQSNETAQ